MRHRFCQLLARAKGSTFLAHVDARESCLSWESDLLSRDYFSLTGCSRKNRENHRRKCFGKKEKGIRIKFNHSLAPISFRTTGPGRLRLIIILFYNFIFKGSHRHYACPYFSSKEKLRKIIARTSLFSQTLELQYFSTFPFGEHVLPATYRC